MTHVFIENLAELTMLFGFFGFFDVSIYALFLPWIVAGWFLHGYTWILDRSRGLRYAMWVYIYIDNTTCHRCCWIGLLKDDVAFRRNSLCKYLCWLRLLVVAHNFPVFGGRTSSCSLNFARHSIRLLRLCLRLSQSLSLLIGGANGLNYFWSRIFDGVGIDRLA